MTVSRSVVSTKVYNVADQITDQTHTQVAVDDHIDLPNW